MADSSGSGPRPVGSVARAVAVIDVLAAHPQGLGVNEVARRIGVNASTTSRLLATLERGGIVQREPRGPYRLGLRLVALADAVLDGLDIRDLGRPVLRSLVEDTGETATLSVPGASEAVTIDFIAGDASVVGVARLGRRSVGHATATGKVVLTHAGLGGSAAQLTAFTDKTITDPDALERELEQVRARGFAEAVGERDPDLVAVAVPVFDRAGSLAAILGVQGPMGRFTATRRKELLPVLRQHGETLTRGLGGKPPPGP
ncbi:MAG TPA: IclR family transcriptional regulator [Thermoleophilaceae bacterium]|nr:IclR family transcriptional regulator [Thermoleophilaceae bacterium]